MKKSLLFIENNVANYQSLIDAAASDTEVYILNAQQDGLQQIADILAGRTDIDALHLVSHGSSGALSLGSITLNSQNINDYQTVLAQMGASLSATGDIFLYGCDVAQGDDSLAFINQLITMTGADVAASNDSSAYAGGNKSPRNHEYRNLSYTIISRLMGMLGFSLQCKWCLQVVLGRKPDRVFRQKSVMPTSSTYVGICRNPCRVTG